MPLKTETQELQTSVRGDDHVLGPTDAAITIVIYADFECPFSARAYRALQGIFHAYPTRVRIAYRHFPKADKHAHALQAARVAEFAAEYDRFWEMADILFDNQEHLSPDDLGMYLRTLELSEREFRQKSETHAFDWRIARDYDSARQNDVTSVPTLFINAARFENEDDEYQELENLARDLAHQK